MAKTVIKRKAPVQLTGGIGFRNENCVAARLLLDLLAGTNALGVDFGKIDRAHWQGRDLGWLADDLVVNCTSPAGKHSVGISLKSDRQVTSAGFPSNFVGIAWAQWLGVETDRVLRNSDDAIALMSGSLAHDVEDAWSNMLADALNTTPERMVARLAETAAGEGSQSSAIQRALFASLHCPDELRGAGDCGDSATIQLLCHIRLLQFDFETMPSRDHDHALGDCQSVLRSGDADDAKALWSRLIAIADSKSKRAGGSIDLVGLLAELRDEFDFCDHPDYRRDWQALDGSTSEAMADVRRTIAGLSSLAREAEQTKVQNCLDRDRACLLVGESGSGKSALTKQIAETNYHRCVWFAETTLDHDTERAFEVRDGHGPIPRMPAAPAPVVIPGPQAPSPPMQEIFMLRSARYRDDDGNQVPLGQYRKYRLPLRIAELALQANVACSNTDPRVRQLMGMSGMVDPDLPRCFAIDGSELEPAKKPIEPILSTSAFFEPSPYGNREPQTFIVPVSPIEPASTSARMMPDEQ
jgi:hypothetical protein